MKIKVYDEFQFSFLHHPFGTKMADVELSFLQWINLKLNGYIPFFKGKPEGFVGETIFYIVNCRKHGYYLSYPQGYFDEEFPCPLCLEEIMKKLKS